MRLMIWTCAVWIGILAMSPALAHAQVDPASANGIFSDGFRQLRSGDAAGAEAKFQAGLKLDATNAMAWFYLGEAYKAEGRASEAAGAYQQSLTLNPASTVAAKAQARLVELAANPAAAPAPQAMAAPAQLAPAPPVPTPQAPMLQSPAPPPPAPQALAAAPAEAPADAAPSAPSLFAGGFAALGGGDAATAQTKFQAGLKLDPTNALAWFYLGEAFSKQGRAADAAGAYQKSLSLNASSAVADKARERLAAAPVQSAAQAPPTPLKLAQTPLAQPPLAQPQPAQPQPARPQPAQAPPAEAAPPAPPPPPALTLPQRPALAEPPAIQLPAGFCSEKERNAFYEATYKPAMDIAAANNAAAKGFLDQLLTLHAQYMKTNLDAANIVTYEAVSYQPIAQAAFKISSDLAAQFDTMMALPLHLCH